MKAVIMAGGEGTRLRPLTCNLPKPMVPILNRPMMEHILNLLKSHQITEIANTLWYLPNYVTDHFGDGSAFDVSMNYYVEEKPLGTAGSVKNAAGFLDETFVVVSGDSLTDINLTEAIEFHKNNQSIATLVLTRVANPLSYGVVITNQEGKIVQFLEKPSWSQVFSDTVNTGIYVLEPEVLDLFPKDTPFDFSRDLFPQLLKSQAPLYGYVTEGYWSDVGNLEVYHQAQQDSLDGKVKLQLPPESDLHSGIYIEEGAIVSPEAKIDGPVYIGEGARIHNDVYLGPYSVIGPNCQIEQGASIKRSTLWPGVQVGSNSQIRGCTFADGVLLQGKVQAYEGVVVGKNTQVGSLTTLKPDTKIWPEKRIPSGSTISASLVWGSQERPSLFTKTGVSGDVRGQLTLESIVQVGLSFAAFLKQGETVLVTSDKSGIGQIVEQALTIGLLNGGINVLLGGNTTGNITRFGVQTYQAKAAFHCQGLVGQDNHANIQCWDRQGRFLSKGDQRKVENIFLREDFPRVGEGELGKIANVTDLSERYLNTLAKNYQTTHKDFKVNLRVEGRGDRDLAQLIQAFLEKAGYKQTSAAQQGVISIVIDNTGWYFENEHGQTLSEDMWWKIFAKTLRTRSKEAIAVPIHVSETVAQTAEKEGLELKWTRLEPMFWMETASELGNTSGDDVEVFPYVEPLASIGEVLQYLSGTNETLAELAQPTGKFTKDDQILCPWKDKGRIMRQLISSSNPEQTRYLDGIKEFTPHGWVLVIPDGDEPVFRIFSEADTPTEAERLVDLYKSKITSYIEEE